MTYELAKKLKEAGFPQTGDGTSICPCSLMEPNAQREAEASGACNDGLRSYIPSLSELIEACGEHIGFGLREEYMGGMFMWRALCDTTAAFGDDKDTAVANLWLALNEK